MITRPFKPVLNNCDFAKLQNWPYYCTPKIDGILCMKVDGRALTSSMKPIPNFWIRKWIENRCPDGFIGELIDRKNPFSFQAATSMVMSQAKSANFVWNVFDFVTISLAYKFRIRDIDLFFKNKFALQQKINFLFPVICKNIKQAEVFLQKCLKQGYEGIILRDPNSVWKNGRATAREDSFWRYKPFIDGEAEIIGFYEQEKNCNIATIDERGLSKRSTKTSGKIPNGTLGGFIVKDRRSNQQFRIGTGVGLNAILRERIWSNQETYKGFTIKYKKQLAGEKDKPRMPIFLGFRDERDISL